MLAIGSKCMRDAISACLCRYFASTAIEPDVNVKRVQAVRIGVLIVMSAHWVGCIYYGLARTWNFDSSTWLAGFEKIIPLYRAGEAEVWFEYLLCVYKGFNRLTALGYEGSPIHLLGHAHCELRTLAVRYARPTQCARSHAQPCAYPYHAGEMPNNEVEIVWSIMVLFIQVYMSALVLGTLLNYLVCTTIPSSVRRVSAL